MIPKWDETDRRGNAEQTAATSRGSATDAEQSNTEEGTPAALSKEEIFDALRNGRRRAAISHLRRHGGALSVNELATRVAADEYDVAPEDLSSEQYKRVYTGLYQCHLQRIDDLGIAEFDTDESTVRLTPQASALDPFLDHEETTGRPGVTLSVAIAATLLVTAGWVGMTLFGVGSPAGLAVLPLGGLVGTALLQF